MSKRCELEQIGNGACDCEMCKNQRGPGWGYQPGSGNNPVNKTYLDGWLVGFLLGMTFGFLGLCLLLAYYGACNG